MFNFLRIIISSVINKTFRRKSLTEDKLNEERDKSLTEDKLNEERDRYINTLVAEGTDEAIKKLIDIVEGLWSPHYQLKAIESLGETRNHKALEYLRPICIEVRKKEKGYMEKYEIRYGTDFYTMEDEYEYEVTDYPNARGRGKLYELLIAQQETLCEKIRASISKLESAVGEHLD